MNLATQTQQSRSKRVLLAEDSTITQDILRIAMDSSGHDITVAQNAREALAFLQEQVFDVALIDYNLPDQNGVELVRAFFKTHQHRLVPRIVALTGDAMEVEDLEKSECHFDLVVAKPFMLSDLVDVINSDESVARAFEDTEDFELDGRPTPLIADEHPFHLIYYPYDFVSSFKNAVSMSIARNGAADAIVFDEIPNLRDREMLCKIKGLGTAAHVDRTKAMHYETDFSIDHANSDDPERVSELVKFLDRRRELRAEIYPSYHLCKDLEINLLINLNLKRSSFTPRINFRDTSGIAYNHLLPTHELEAACRLLLTDGLIDQTCSINLILCPHCFSARLYPQHVHEITDTHKLPLICTDCQTPFLADEALDRTAFEFTITPKAHVFLRQAPQKF